MSDWFRGVIEGSYVGRPAKAVPKGEAPEVSRFDIELYRASVSAIERIASPELPELPAVDPAAAAPDAEAAVPVPSAEPTPAEPKQAEPKHSEPKRAELKQAELNDVTFLGVGAEDARDLHAAYDLRLSDVRLLSSTQVGERLYGRLIGNVVGSLSPSDAMRKQAVAERLGKKKRAALTGKWAEALRAIVIVVGAWLTFGLHGWTEGLLWLGVALSAVVLRVLLRRPLPPTPAGRVAGWALVLVAIGLSVLAYHRVTEVECRSVLWWLCGIAGTVFVTALLHSRYPFLWTKLVWGGTLLALSGAPRAPSCRTKPKPASVVSQGPRTDPDGRWPRTPEVSSAEPRGSAASSAP